MIYYLILCLFAMLFVRDELRDFVAEMSDDYYLNNMARFMMFMGIVMGLPFYALMVLFNQES